MRFEAGDRGGDALPLLGQQREDVDLHGAVTQGHFIGNDFAQRQHFALVVRGDVVSRPVIAIGLARLRTHIDRLLGQPIDRRHISLLGLTQPRLAEIEQRHLQFDLDAA